MRFTIPLIALAAIAAPVTAASQDAEGVVTVRIDYSDIDLSTEAGRAKLEQRVEARLRTACTVESKARYAFGRDILDEKCVAEARSAALAEVERIAATQSRAGGQVAAN